MRQALKVVLAILILIPTAGSGEIRSPDKVVSETTAQIIDLLKTNHDAYAEDHEKLYAMVHQHIVPVFDFKVITKLVLARYYKNATAQQRIQFGEGFRDLLIRTYATALLKYQGEELVFHPFSAKPEDQRVIVKTEFKRRDGGPDVPVNFRFFKGKNGWKAYDVSIEGVSMVTNYRSVYTSQIKREGLDAVIEKLSLADQQALK
ncbi:MAG: phospholipid-binding protein MlaC [Acidiferrobacterales bacterium]